MTVAQMSGVGPLAFTHFQTSHVTRSPFASNHLEVPSTLQQQQQQQQQPELTSNGEHERICWTYTQSYNLII